LVRKEERGKRDGEGKRRRREEREMGP